MLNVLSIDIDYAYSPSIAGYDDYIEGSRISLDEQKRLLSDVDAPQPAVNQAKLDLIREVVLQKVAKNTPFHMIENHNEILQLLPKNKELSIYNFDHHHDVFYPGWHTLEVLDEGNWVSHLGDYSIKSFYWIRNNDSEERMDNVSLDFVWNEIYLLDINTLPSFDLVVGCVSPHWTDENSRKHLKYVLEGL